jgi:bifunctional non-homologous end joining protein LigD
MLWRTRPVRSRRSPPAGFISPAQPMLVAKPRAGPEWIHEVKHDGYRLLARKEAGRVTLWSRYGTGFTDNMPRIAEAVRALPVADAFLDGEAVVFRPDGHSDFAALRTKRSAAEAAFVAFDLLQIDGEDRRKLALEVRRAELASLVAGIDAITYSEAIEAEGAIVFAKACELGLEGIVSKRLGGAYWSGRCRNWLKVKNPDFRRE